MVSAQDAGAVAPECVEQGGVGMAVVVACADGDEGDAWGDGVEECRALVGRAVVGDFEDVGA